MRIISLLGFVSFLAACDDGNRAKSGASDREANHRPAGLLTDVTRERNSQGQPASTQEIDPSEILAQIHKYSPEFMASYFDYEKFASQRSFRHFARGYGKYLASLTDPDLLLAHLRQFPREDHNRNLRAQLQRIGKESPLTTPAFVVKMADALGTSSISAYSHRELGIGIGDRINKMPDKAERRQMAQEYLAPDIHPTIAAQVMVSVIDEIVSEFPNDDACHSWLRSLPEGKVARRAEGRYIRETVKTDPEVAISYVQELFDAGEFDRAAAGIDNVVVSYMQTDAQAAFDWASALPADLGEHRERAIRQCYIEYMKIDPETADAKLQTAIDDPDVRKEIRDKYIQLRKEWDESAARKRAEADNKR